MGIFNRKKVCNDSKCTTSTEFDNDMAEMLARDDVQSRHDICKLEFEKAIKLTNNTNESEIHRAYDIMGHLASQFNYPPAIMWMGDFSENVTQDLSQAVFWYKKAANLGDGNGARCYADMLMVGKGIEQNPQQAFEYYAVAADKGVPEAAFMIGEFFRNNGNRDKALKAYKQARDAGFTLAIARIKQMGGE